MAWKDGNHWHWLSVSAEHVAGSNELGWRHKTRGRRRSHSGSRAFFDQVTFCVSGSQLWFCHCPLLLRGYTKGSTPVCGFPYSFVFVACQPLIAALFTMAPRNAVSFLAGSVRLLQKRVERLEESMRPFSFNPEAPEFTPKTLLPLESLVPPPGILTCSLPMSTLLPSASL